MEIEKLYLQVLSSQISDGDAKGLLYIDAFERTHHIDFSECARNFAEEHGGSGLCVAELCIEKELWKIARALMI